MAGPVLENERQYGWGSLVLTWAEGTIECEGYTELRWAHTRTSAKGRGEGRHQAPTVRTSGEYDCENVGLSIRPDHADALREGLKQVASDHRSYGNVVFQLMAQLIDGDVVSTREFRSVKLAKEGGTVKQGPDGLLEEIELDTMRIIVNGGTLYDSSGPNSPL